MKFSFHSIMNVNSKVIYGLWNTNKCVKFNKTHSLCFMHSNGQRLVRFTRLYKGSIATDYGLDGPGIESRWGRDFPPVQTGPGAHPASCTMGTGSFPGVKWGRGVLLTTHPLLAPRS